MKQAFLLTSFIIAKRDTHYSATDTRDTEQQLQIKRDAWFVSAAYNSRRARVEYLHSWKAEALLVTKRRA